MPRPQWGVGGMPDPPPGVARGSFMGDRDLRDVGLTAGQISALTPPVAPSGGATVGGVFYPGGSWLPRDIPRMILHRVIEFENVEGKSRFRTGKISVALGRTDEQIEASWRRFLQRWKRISDETAKFADEG